MIDPVDGTTNFAHGIPLCGVIIAHASNGEVVFGLIYDPLRNETFTAWKEGGAYLNGERTYCCNRTTLAESVLVTGSPPNMESFHACMRGTTTVGPEVRTIRMLGSAAIMLSWVACGRVTGYFEADLNAWDLAAGALIVKEAGGRVTDVWGKDYELATRNVVATNGDIHEVLRRKLYDAKMWRIVE